MKILNILITICIIQTSAYCQNNNDLDDDENLWGLSIGYFPYLNDNSYVSSGMSASITFESLSDNIVNWGWYFIFRKTFEDQLENQPDGSYSLGASISYCISTAKGRFLTKVGMGFGYPATYLNVTNIISIEYQHGISENIFLSISLTEEIVGFNLFLPPLINVGIVF